MPSLPNKSVKGSVFKKWVVESIDRLIDYLSSTYIQVGQGLKIRRSPSGLVIELDKQPAEQQRSSSGGGDNAVIGFPDYNQLVSFITTNVDYFFDYPVWVIGHVEHTENMVQESTTISVGGTTYYLMTYSASNSTVNFNFSLPVLFPISANTHFDVQDLKQPAQHSTYLRIYKCL